MMYRVMNDQEVILQGKDVCESYLKETGKVTGTCECCGLPTVHIGHWLIGEVDANWFCANLECDKGNFDAEIIEHIASLKGRRCSA